MADAFRYGFQALRPSTCMTYVRLRGGPLPCANQLNRNSATLALSLRAHFVHNSARPLRVETAGSNVLHRSRLDAECWRGRARLRGSLGFRQFSSQYEKQNEKSQSTPTESTKAPLRKRLRTALTPHENIYTLPNLLTFSRLAAAPVIGYLVIHDANAWAFGLFAYAGVTDLIDGWIARRWQLQTVVGTVIDPMADKTLMTVLTVCLAVKATLPLYLAVLILGRDALLGLAAIYYRYISLPPPKTLARFWDFSLPSAEVHPTAISKVNTALQLALIGTTLGMPLVDVAKIAWAPEALSWFHYVVATTTVWSGASYVYSKDAVKILDQEEKSKSDFKG